MQEADVMLSQFAVYLILGHGGSSGSGSGLMMFELSSLF